MDAPYVFLDLDDTLLVSRRRLDAMAEQWGNDPTGELTVGARDAEGNANGFLRPSHRSLMTLLSGSCQLIPTTCRTLEQFHRTTITAYRSAVLYGGGMILNPDGKMNKPWADRIETQLNDHAQTLGLAEGIARRVFSDRPDALIRFASFRNVNYFLFVKDTTGDVERIAELESAIDDEIGHDDALVLQPHGHGLYIAPKCVSKRAAVRYLMDELPATSLSIGIGDSTIDFGFMDLCDFAMTPTYSRLWELLAERTKHREVSS